MITKKDITHLNGKAVLTINTELNFAEFVDIFEDDMEWNNLNDLKTDIKEYLYDNIEQNLFWRYKEKIGYENIINYKIKYEADLK